MTKTIAIANQNRGGAEAHPVGNEARRKPSEQQAMRAAAKQCAVCELRGKTSTTVNLGAGLVRQGYAVLAIDFDPQANLTMALGFKSPDDMEYTVANVLAKVMDEEPINPSEGILTTAEGVDLLPSSIQLSRFELALVNEMNRESMLRQFVDAAKPNYDYILIDCAPSLNVLALNALTAADSVLIPTQPEFFSNAGQQMLLSTVSKVRKKINPSLNIASSTQHSQLFLSSHMFL